MKTSYVVAAAALLFGAAAIARLGAAGAQVRTATAAAVPAVERVSAADRALLDRYCVTCHNQRLKTGGLALDTLDLANIGHEAETWEKVVRKLRAGMMPPAGLPRPDSPTYQGLAARLEGELDRAWAASPNPGRPDTFRRLNRNEYQNAIRDLLAIDVDVRNLLPQDDSSHGFDNTSVANFSPTLLERYLSAAQKISRAVVGTPPRSAVAETVFLPDDLTQDDHFEGLPFGTRGGTVVTHTFPVDAEYQIQVRLGRDRDGQLAGMTAPHTLEITLDGERRQMFNLQPVARGRGANAQAGQDQEANLIVRLPLTAGPHAVGVSFLKKPSVLIETERQPWLRRHAGDYGDQRPQPVVYSIAIAGPFETTGPGDSPSRRRVFTCRPALPSEEAGCARSILSVLARRAYRGQVSDDKLKALVGFYEQGREGATFEAGIENALRALLTSPEFLFRVERGPAPQANRGAYRLNDFELASRLSFFLWSSIPDDELLDRATKGELKNAAVLEAQARRMLADPRSAALVSNFAGQWLYLRNIASTTPDPRLFPDFDEGLRRAFREETELFFDSVLREERSILNLLDADYTFVNERLARHYGMPNIYGSRFRRVRVTDENRRGLLGHGSILTATAYATRTSPVLRGKWILDNIMGTPPPPPPPDVPPLGEKKQNAQGKIMTMRERMAQHRSNAVCANCHSMIDPAGFALENFDAIGRWRDHDETFNAIDTSGALPNGAKFQNVVGLRQALLATPELFVTTVTEKLLIYALGRGVEYYDMPAIRAIVRESATTNYTLSSVILGIIKSTPFQMRGSLPS